MASNSHGNSNEIEIVTYLNGKKIKDLNLTMKEFIKYVCTTKDITFNEDANIGAEYEKNNKLKQDIYLIINEVKIGVSLKMGTGNSMHQEKIENFVSFIRTKCGASEEICNLWRFFIWADGTYDGSGSIEKGADGKIICRFGTKEFKNKYPDKRNTLQHFLDSNKAILVERALFIGQYDSDVDFYYHGTYKQGRWISKKEVIDFLVKQRPKSDSTCLRIGNLSIQPWNVSLKGGKGEKKRGQIQFKYGTINKDLDMLMKNKAESIGTFFGELEEFDLTKTMNKNKDNHMWKVLLPNVTDFTNYYLVKVSSNQFSKLSEKTVKTKSDAYVVNAEIPKNFLLQKEYVLEESDLLEYKYSYIENTGISIKIKNSKNFTYQKLTKNSFCKAFCNLDDPEFWLTSLLIYSADKERYKNEKIITDLGNTMDEFLNKVNSKMNIAMVEIDNSLFWDTVRKKAQSKVKEEIIKDNKLYENIFTGKYWFNSPYHADFLYEGGELRKNIVTSFAITTGSGRSKGKYTIEIIPA